MLFKNFIIIYYEKNPIQPFVNNIRLVNQISETCLKSLLEASKMI